MKNIHEIYSILLEPEIGIYMDKNLKFLDGNEIFFIGATPVNNLERIKNKLNPYKVDIIEIETSHYGGLYLNISPLLSGIIISPKNEVVSCDQTIFNLTQSVQMAKELRDFGEKSNLKNLVMIDQSTFGALWGIIKNVIADLLDIPIQHLNFIEYENSHREFSHLYLEYKNNKKSLYVHNEMDPYNHIESFCWYYYWEIKIIAEFSLNKTITIYDVGTCAAFFPLLISCQPSEELMGLNVTRIYASDIKIEGEEFARKLLEQNPNYKPVEFITLDLIRDSTLLPSADVIILNDVLEHLPDDESSFKALSDLWNKTGEILIAHVPFEDKPTPTWGHFITFNEKKIRQWSAKLPGAHFLSDVYPYDKYRNLIHEGYLVAVKTEGKLFSQVDFYNRVRLLINTLDFNVYINSGWFKEKKHQIFPVLGALDSSHFDSLKICLKKEGFCINETETQHYHIIFIKETPECRGIFIAPKRGFTSTSQDVLNQSRSSILAFELKEFLKSLDPGVVIQINESIINQLLREEEFVLMEVLDIPILKIFVFNYENSRQEIARIYFGLKNNTIKIHNIADSPRSLEISTLVYYQEIKIMAEYFKNQPISIHDVGTGSAHLPLLLSSLSLEELFGLNVANIYASDVVLTWEPLVKKALKKNKGSKPIEFFNIDVTGGLKNAPESDVLTANNVLEYLPDEKTAFSALDMLWKKTKKLLIIHIQIDEKTTLFPEPLLFFDEKKIWEWALRLNGASLLSDKYYGIDGNPLSFQGYLIAEKTKELNKRCK